MPTYDYECDACGPFTAVRPMARFQDPCACPRCTEEAPRSILSAPAIASGSPEARVAGARSESRAAAYAPAASAGHPAGCGCCVRRLPLPSALSAGGRIFRSHGPAHRSGQ
ncbi:FmdB family zinc ribbon protein [Methylopila sp. Yamaguchi]|uniref:FmdB family zinc ribbon protein n=1 Tax=Methylopila sp. Yamaguchi TaxID=1437817 RepID=UPI000CCC9334|nr:zinc ribbon domain-containing protein [Methylopila sp. Yamaguchi]